MAAIPLVQIGVHLRPNDNIAVTAKTLAAGSEIQFNGSTLKLPVAVKMGHKFAVHPIKEGEAIYKYGQIIGFARKDIAAGRSRSRPQRRRRRLRARLRLLPRLSAAAASRRRPNVSGLRSRAGSAANIALRHAQLHRHHQHRQLLGQHQQVHLRALPRTDLLKQFRTSTASWPSRTRPAAPCSTTAPITTSSTARWPGLPGIPTSAAYILVGLGCETGQAMHLIEKRAA